METIACGALLCGAIVAAAPAQAATEPDAPQRVYLYAPLTGEKKEMTTNAQRTRGGGISTKSIGPYGNTYCNTAESSFALKRYQTSGVWSYEGGKTSLKCGNSSYGFKHIQQRHAAQWISRYAKLGPTNGLDWSDILDFALTTTLDAPYIANPIRPGSANKTCFAGIVEARSYPGNKLLFRYEPTVVVSQNNRHIITAIPSTKEECGKQSL